MSPPRAVSAPRRVQVVQSLLRQSRPSSARRNAPAPDRMRRLRRVAAALGPRDVARTRP
jgi:hypothetical protein